MNKKISEPTCPPCDRDFDSFRAFSAHNAAVHDGNALVNLLGVEPLSEMYAEGTERDVADRLGVNQATLHNALQEIGVDTSNPQHSEHPNLITSQGYERITHKDHQILHHRLIAVAEYGFESVRNLSVHHESEEPYENTRENVSPMTQADHIREHGLPKSGGTS